MPSMTGMMSRTSQKLMPAKTRAFVDFMTQAFRDQKMAERYSAM